MTTACTSDALSSAVANNCAKNTPYSSAVRFDSVVTRHDRSTSAWSIAKQPSLVSVLPTSMVSSMPKGLDAIEQTRSENGFRRFSKFAPPILSPEHRQRVMLRTPSPLLGDVVHHDSVQVLPLQLFTRVCLMR